MKAPFIVNDNRAIGRAGDITVFKTAADLELYIEPWYVDEPHFIFDSEGNQLEIVSDGHRVHLIPKDPKVFAPDIVRNWLADFLRAIAGAKGWHHVGVDESFVETASLSQLVEVSSKFATR
ncbi:MAG: hypothetical protein JSS04_01235 [Proteobacteria bacterium]|nr:hypothetical protein [Pseudomonadota bacterium]